MVFKSELSSHLDKLVKLDDVSAFVEKLKADVPLTGGRRFTHPKMEGSISLKDIIRKVDQLVTTSRDPSASPTKIKSHEVLPVLVQIEKKDIEAKQLLEKQDKFTKWMTCVRQFFGNLFYSVHKRNETRLKYEEDQDFKCYRAYYFQNELPLKKKFAQTKIEIKEAYTLEAAEELAKDGESKVALLDMAKDTLHDGYLHAATAQEGSLIGGSVEDELAIRLKNVKDYRLPNNSGRVIPDDGCIYLKSVTYAPADIYANETKVADQKNKMIKIATLCTAAINISDESISGKKADVANYEERMKDKIRATLFAAQANGHSKLVLGAFGCGVFGNDPKEVATFYKDILDAEFPRVFEHIVFAIKGGPKENSDAFEEVFNPKSS